MYSDDTHGDHLGCGLSMYGYLPRLVSELGISRDDRHLYVIVAHLFEDTMRMIEAVEPFYELQAIIGVPYSSDRPSTRARWAARFGSRVKIASSLEGMEADLAEVLDDAFMRCAREGRRLIVQEVGGFVPAMLLARFADRLHLVAGVVEITKQGVWRGSALPLPFPVLHCAESVFKRLEAQRCGETVARCIDGVARDMGLSLAGRPAAVLGGGWIGAGVARALARLDMHVSVADLDPLRQSEALLNGFAPFTAADAGRMHLLVGAAGALSIGPSLLSALPPGAFVASASSRRIEIAMGWLERFPSVAVHPAARAHAVPGAAGPRPVVVINQGFPANFIEGGGSVADEIVEVILGELIVLMERLRYAPPEPGVHAMTPDEEKLCARVWLAMRSAPAARASLHPSL